MQMKKFSVELAGGAVAVRRHLIPGATASQQNLGGLGLAAQQLDVQRAAESGTNACHRTVIPSGARSGAHGTKWYGGCRGGVSSFTTRALFGAPLVCRRLGEQRIWGVAAPMEM
jgi:hypothetical protein